MGTTVVAGLQVLVAGGALCYLWIGMRVRRAAAGPTRGPFALLAVVTGLAGLVLAVPPLVGSEAPFLVSSYPLLYLVPVAWLVFVLEYVGYDVLGSPRVLGPLIAVALLGLGFNLLTWGRELAGLLFSLLWIGNIVALLALVIAGGVLVVGIVLLLWTWRRQSIPDSRTLALLTVAGTFPWVVTMTGIQLSFWVRQGLLAPMALWAVLGLGVGPGAVAAWSLARAGRIFDRLPAPANLGPDAVFEQLSEPVLVLDHEGRVVRRNPAARTSLPTAGAGPATEDLADLLGVGLAELDRTSQLSLDHDAETRLYEPVVSTLDDRAGRGIGAAVVLHDVTDLEARNRRVAELDRTRAELERKNERLDQFATIVSHDLRNPLTVAKGFTEAASQRDDVSHLDKVAEAHDRMERLLDELLTLARAGADRGAAERVGLDAVAREAWGGVQTDGMALEVGAELPAIVADESGLRQVFENLYRNAAEHATPDQDDGTDQEVTVTVGSRPDGFYVADDGRGIPESDRDRVFEHGVTTADQGTGFGLSIVREMVEAHGWAVDVTESEAGGARFEVTGVQSATG